MKIIENHQNDKKKMEKDIKEQNELTLLKPRSVGATIRDGYRLYTGSFRNILRRSWLCAVIYALLMGAAMSIIVSLSGAAPYALATLVTASLMLSAAGYSALSLHMQSDSIGRPAKWYGSLNNHIVVRTAISTLAIVVIGAIFALLSSAALWALQQAYLSRIATIVTQAILAIIALMAAPIICMAITGYTLRPVSKWWPFGNTLPLRYWGASFMACFVVAIITSVLLLVTCLPAVVLISANIVSQAGVLQGDPTGMPDYMVWTNLIVFSIAGFIQAYVQLSALFPLYYLYGSIEQQESERRQLLQ